MEIKYSKEQFLDDYYCANCGKLHSDPDYYEDCIAYIRTADEHLKSEITKNHHWRRMGFEKVICEYCGKSPGIESFCNNSGILFNRNHNFSTESEIVSRKNTKEAEQLKSQYRQLKSYGIDIIELKEIVNKNRQLILDYIKSQLLYKDLASTTNIFVSALKKSCASGIHCDSLCIDKENPLQSLLLKNQNLHESDVLNLMNDILSTFDKYKLQTSIFSFEFENVDFLIGGIMLTSQLEGEENQKVVYLIYNGKKLEFQDSFFDKLLGMLDLENIKQVIWLSVNNSQLRNKINGRIKFIDIEMLSAILLDLEIGVRPMFKIYEPDKEFFNPVVY